MSNCLPYVDAFFEDLEIYEDTACGHSYKAFISGSLREFLGNENRENAINVYRTFFDCYRICIDGQLSLIHI